MAGMTGFVRRGVCFAWAALFLGVVAGEGADLTFVVRKGDAAGLFMTTKNGVPVSAATGVSIDKTISAIAKESVGADVEIRFDATGGALDIGAGSVKLEARGAQNGSWKSVTLSGALKGSGRSVPVVGLYCHEDSSAFRVVNKANIFSNGAKGAIWANGRIRLTLDACTLSCTNWGTVVKATVKDTLVVNGGVYSSDSGDVLFADGIVRIKDGTFMSKEGLCIFSKGGIEINGGTYSSGTYSPYESTVYLCDKFTITGGVFKTVSGMVAYIAERGEGEIYGGKFEATGNGYALRCYYGKVSVMGGAEFINDSAEKGAIIFSGGNISFDNVTVSNRGPSGDAIQILAVRSKLTLGKAVKIEGAIASRFADAINLTSSFGQNDQEYTLKLTGAACADNAVAVVGGGEYFDYFKFANKYYTLDEKDKDIIVKLKTGVNEPDYVITGNKESGFTATRIAAGDGRDSIVGSGYEIKDILSSISDDAGGRQCGIRFGRDGNGIDLGKDIVSFGSDVAKWGKVLLKGKFNAETPDYVRGNVAACLYVVGGISVESDVEITTKTHGYGVHVKNGAFFTYNGRNNRSCGNIRNTGGTVTVVSGTVPYIENDGGGFFEITGGTIGSKSRNEFAINNGSGSQLYISDSANVVSTNRYIGGTIHNNGALFVAGGEVSNVGISSNGASVAICNRTGYGTYDTATAIAHIYGDARIFSGGAGESGVIYNERGIMRISGGKIYNTTDTVGAVIVNYGRLTIDDAADIESESRYTRYNGRGTIYSPSVDTSCFASALNIVGGVVKAKDGYAVYSDGAGGVTVSGEAVISTSDSVGAIYIGADGCLKLLGGEVLFAPDPNDTTVYKGAHGYINLGGKVPDPKDTAVKTVKAIDAYGGGHGGYGGRLVMGGSPIVDGVISLPGLDSIPIEIAMDCRNIFYPNGETYHIVGRVSNGHVVLKNGVNCFRSFILDTAGNTGLKLAVNGNDAVAAMEAYYVEFDINGSNSEVPPPVSIPVIMGGTIGDMARPPTRNYILQSNKYIIENDREWHIYNGMVGNVVDMGLPFNFGVGDNGTRVTEKMRLILSWTGDSIRVSVQEASRDLPPANISESVAISPVVPSSGGLTAGPSPVSSSSGTVGFFRSGAALKAGKLFIYDASGNIVTRIIINDNHGNADRRPVARWDLRDANGRKVTEGTYAAKGVITAKRGKAEKVSILINVRK
jgi:hypothetical protein